MERAEVKQLLLEARGIPLDSEHVQALTAIQIQLGDAIGDHSPGGKTNQFNDLFVTWRMSGEPVRDALVDRVCQLME